MVVQLHLSTTVTMGTEKRGRCREVAVSEGSTANFIGSS